MKHHETLIIRCDDIGAWRGDCEEVIRCDVGDRAELPARVFGDIGDCRVCITPQMCNIVTNHGYMGTFSKPEVGRAINTIY